MEIPHYLAMTAAEIQKAERLPEKMAWMACHFSPYSTGLTNIPEKLPKDSLLIVNDRTPIHGHDPVRVADELNAVCKALQCAGILLDFQNTPCEESLHLAQYLTEHIEQPLGVAAPYWCKGAAVFLPCLPTNQMLSDYLENWSGEKVWLETALIGQDITLSANGADFRSAFGVLEGGFEDTSLHCHYRIEDSEDRVILHTWRNRDDLAKLIAEAADCGVLCCVGLYQELYNYPH